jgi:putative lysine decarboxylase
VRVLRLQSGNAAGLCRSGTGNGELAGRARNRAGVWGRPCRPLGALADACLARSGRVTGVMPGALVEKEIAHRGLTELRVVQSMHERKALMADLANAFVALPGGYATSTRNWRLPIQIPLACWIVSAAMWFRP